jgi:hypothetical protein
MDNKAGKRPMRMTTSNSKKLMMVLMRRELNEKQHKILLKVNNKPEEGLTVSQSQQLDNTFEEHQRLTRRD